MRFTISEEVLNKILQVLGNAPYAQIAALIQEIQADVKKEEPKTE